jgi:hypothetical protein
MASKSKIRTVMVATSLAVAGAVGGGVAVQQHFAAPAIKVEAAQPRLPLFLQMMQERAKQHHAPVARPAGQPNQLPLFLQQMQARRAEQAKHPQPKPAVSKVPSGTIPPFILQRMLARQRQQIAGHR